MLRRFGNFPKRYADADPDKITSYVLDNVSRYEIITLNSELLEDN